MKEIKWENYILRKAAGENYLLDISQRGKPYIKPLILNDSAAAIVAKLMSGHSVDEVAYMIAGDDKTVQQKQVCADIEALLSSIYGGGTDE